MQRYDHMFSRLKAANQGAFVPFVTLGDPTAELSFDIIKTLVDNGADALELGIPFPTLSLTARPFRALTSAP